jgi:hypothetical protein
MAAISLRCIDSEWRADRSSWPRILGCISSRSSIESFLNPFPNT